MLVERGSQVKSSEICADKLPVLILVCLSDQGWLGILLPLRQHTDTTLQELVPMYLPAENLDLGQADHAVGLRLRITRYAHGSALRLLLREC